MNWLIGFFAGILILGLIGSTIDAGNGPDTLREICIKDGNFIVKLYPTGYACVDGGALKRMSQKSKDYCEQNGGVYGWDDEKNLNTCNGI